MSHFQSRQRRKGKIKTPGTLPAGKPNRHRIMGEDKTSRSRPLRPIKDRVWIAMLNLKDRLTMRVKRKPTRKDRGRK